MLAKEYDLPERGDVAGAHLSANLAEVLIG
jgi:hypothetical protein